MKLFKKIVSSFREKRKFRLNTELIIQRKEMELWRNYITGNTSSYFIDEFKKSQRNVIELEREISRLENE